MTATAEHIALAHRLFDDFFSQGKLDVADSIISPRHICHNTAYPGTHGPKAMKQFVSLYRHAFQDLRITVEDVKTEGDMVIVHWHLYGTHQGTLINLPPTGRAIDIAGFDILHVVGGQIEEEWTYWDTFGMMKQIGMISSMD